jgi:hypothetical protein
MAKSKVKAKPKYKAVKIDPRGPYEVQIRGRSYSNKQLFEFMMEGFRVRKIKTKKFSMDELMNTHRGREKLARLINPVIWAEIDQTVAETRKKAKDPKGIVDITFGPISEAYESLTLALRIQAYFHGLEPECGQ